MKRYLIILLALVASVSLSAQNKKQTKKAATVNTVSKKRATTAKTATTAKKTTATTGKKNNEKGKAATTSKKTTTTYTNNSIKNLQKERSSVQRQIRQQEKALRANKADVKRRLDELVALNSQIVDRQKNINNIQADINGLNDNISILESQLKTLEDQLADRKTKYIKSMRYMAKHKNVQDKLMFIFSAKNFAQMYRRMRFVREYANYQRAQGEALKLKQQQVEQKRSQLQDARSEKHTLLYKGEQERAALQTQQDEQQKMVNSLQRQQVTIQNIINEQRQKDAVLNSKIDQLIAREVEKARQRAAAEARKKAQAAAEAKRRAEELAKKKAAAEAAKRENERRIAEAKAREEKARQAAREAESSRKAAAEQAAHEAQAAREAAERKAAADEARSKKEIKVATERNEEAMRVSTVDRMLSGGFAANKGRLPMPITGKHRIVSHFGQYNVEGLKNVTLDNKGINILGTAGCHARAIYDGEVSGVFGYGGTMVVMVRHGVYISVYCNLSSVSVSTGQKVSTGQSLGAVASDHILQFQLRKETAKLNPEAWLAR
jgi:septal ring factor EnvC (AmiA/AmiB activator)